MSTKSIAVITGASSGIGAVYADRLASRGYHLILVARRGDRLQQLAATLSETYGTDTTLVQADLTTETGLSQLEQLLATNENIDLLVNNAGNGKLSATVDIAPADVISTIALNVTAPTRLARALIPGLIARKKGAIINIASVMAFHALPITTVYSATKSFLLTFSRGLQAELKEFNIYVQAVLPAGTATEFYDHSGIPLSAFDPAAVMTTEQLVDAALVGFDAQEEVTLPSVHDHALWTAYDASRAALFAGTQNGRPAPRYSPS